MSQCRVDVEKRIQHRFLDLAQQVRGYLQQQRNPPREACRELDQITDLYLERQRAT
jgi:hypothetical protein